ncbi:hypothetical protein [Lentzea californiensis]|uniref:hypothetical protein n=1 Tax=Lentzea californiensis TaxID=438851 RepID=UPI00216605B9|nr:hypothetical protein [Lentzea californiensis]MCR3752188.1 hypothetical protein [Lentzea californiensis]
MAKAVPADALRVYETYWNRIVDEWGDKPTPLDIKQLAERIEADAVVRKNSPGGRSAAEHLIAAARCLYQHAIADRLMPKSDNPARRVAKPRRGGTLALRRCDLSLLPEVVCRKPRPCSSSRTPILVDDSAKTIPSIVVVALVLAQHVP